MVITNFSFFFHTKAKKFRASTLYFVVIKTKSYTTTANKSNAVNKNAVFYRTIFCPCTIYPLNEVISFFAVSMANYCRGHNGEFCFIVQIDMTATVLVIMNCAVNKLDSAFAVHNGRGKVNILILVDRFTIILNRAGQYQFFTGRILRPVLRMLLLRLSAPAAPLQTESLR